MTFPLSKTLDPADFDELKPELAIVDQHFTAAREQHPMRKWEYALALRAFSTWEAQTSAQSRRLVDVGGAGSPFRHMTAGWYGPVIVDPEETCSLEEYLASRPSLADAVVCLSVLEHVEALDEFLYHLSCLVAPGGLLVLTMDCCNSATLIFPSDIYHFHWMRNRIFNPYTIGRSVVDPLLRRDFSIFGLLDYTWRGPQVFDYTFASLALVKRP